MRRGIDLILKCALLVALVCFYGAESARAEGCKPWPQMLSDAQQHPIYKNHVVLDAEQTAAANAIMRQMEGAPEVDWNLVVLMTLQDGSGLVVVGNDGAICGGFGVPKEIWYKLVSRLVGAPA